ncbi:MAG: response regulator [Myxococcota bacterium]|jgi:response regulator RpfG family c-di-GMP phosphodiesterase|nr:hypothetical protein [Deltaproteobacteria bacterium]MCP4243458.1 response regulator [bacterium]MDP6076297.1 response regulator [Myxococcota bacterium]MDP6243270.1 response regulator [Myxococcota bacterium]MDP7074857.1 response regulator [Myxococcota bacterium]
MGSPRPRILVVDDEEAILETMTFTFEDDYEIHTSSDARRALELLDEHAPFAVVLTDQRMPNMSGVDFLKEVWQRYPATVCMILTGFADVEAIIEAINHGHVYAYITKPWEPDQLKQVMKQAVNHYELSVDNDRLLVDLKRATVFLEAMMDQLDTGALAVDGDGVIRAASRPARDYLALEGDPRGKPLSAVLSAHGLGGIGETIERLAVDEATSFEEVDVTVADRSYRLRVALHNLAEPSGDNFGRVVLLREISHEPLRRRFEQVVAQVVDAADDLRPVLGEARQDLKSLGDELAGLYVDSPGVGELEERLGQTLTAIDNWLDVDDALTRENYPDAQVLQDRLRVALSRWPLPDRVPERVRALARAVEDYYESGENPGRPVL